MRPLEPYERKRRFDSTPEPRGERRSSRTKDVFVVQKHRARQLHYDFRLEVDGVLKSWAVPKGPSLDPSEKRMAVAVEDHPLEYANFEGVIPRGEYGAGAVMVWDRGRYEVEGDTDVSAALRKGRLKLVLDGQKLRGAWALVRMRGKSWLLIKHRDEFADDRDIEREASDSVATGRTLEQIAAGEARDAARAARGDPPHAQRRRGARPKEVRSDLRDVTPGRTGAAFPHDREKVPRSRSDRRPKPAGARSDGVPRLVPAAPRERRGGRGRSERLRHSSAR